jgi:PAS domain S-box-containing protein
MPPKEQAELALFAPVYQFFESIPLPMGIIEVDREELRVLVGSRSLRVHLARSPSAGVPTEAAFEFPAQRRAHALSMYARSVTDGAPVREVTEVTTTDGLRVMEETVMALPGATPERGRYVFWAADVTERLQRERLLLEMQQKVQAITDNLNAVIWMTDVSKERIIYVSPAYERIWERPVAEVYEQPRSFVDVIHPEDRDRVVAAFARQKEGTFAETYRLRMPDGRIKWISDRASPIRDAEGRVLQVVGIAQDITEQHAQAESTRRAKERFESLVSAAPVMLSLFKPDGEFVWCNPEWERVLGWSVESMRGRDILAEFYPDAAQRGRALEFMTSGTGWMEFDTRTRSGHVVPTRWTNVRLSDGYGLGIGQEIGWARDQQRIIREQQARIVADAKMASLGRMAGGIAHEINNPLAIIHATADVLRAQAERGPLSPAQLKDGLDKVRSTAERIARIVRGLRAFARPDENDPFVSVSVRQIVDDAVELSRARFRDAEVELRLGALSNVRLRCRPVQVMQVVLNLLGNALDAVQGLPGAWVEVEVVDDDACVELRVTDSGSGIAPEVVDRMMEPFYTTKPAGVGTGLGLSISQGIAASHGGELLYQPAGEHTRFVLVLPLREGGVGAGA